MRRAPLPIDQAHRLLIRACGDLVAGRREPAEAAIEKALRLPWDELDDVDTALNVASMLLSGAVMEAFDDCPVDDNTWLQHVEVVLDRCGPHARTELRRTLARMARDRGLDAWDRERIRRRLVPVQELEGGIDRRIATERLPDPERRQIVVEHLEALVQLRPEIIHTVVPRCW
jgi:hypothetical protein